MTAHLKDAGTEMQTRAKIWLELQFVTRNALAARNRIQHMGGNAMYPTVMTVWAFEYWPSAMRAFVISAFAVVPSVA